MAKKTIPVNNYNDSDNYGTSGEAPSLYSDKHYLDGDGFLYGLGMASQRMIVKGKTADIDDYFLKWQGTGTAVKLILNLTNAASSLASNHKGVGHNGDGQLQVDTGMGVYVGANSQDANTYGKVNINLYKQNATIEGDTAPDPAISGLEFADGITDSTQAPTSGQLRIKLTTLGSGGNQNNISGLVLENPALIGSSYLSGGLRVNYDSNTITLNAQGQLGLKLLAGEHQGDISGMRVVTAGTVDESGDTLLGGLAVNVQAPLSVRNISTGESAVILDGGDFIQWFGAGGSDWGLDSTLSYYSDGARYLIGFNRDIIGQGLNVAALGNMQYRIDVMPGDYTEIKTMGTSGNQYTAVDVDIPALFAQVTRDKSIYGIGITPNSNASHANNLYVDGSVLAGDGLQGTGYSDSDSTITPKLKLKIANGSPLYIDSTNKALNLRIGDGLIVTNTSTTPTLQFAMGSGFKKSGESIDVAAYNGITVNSNGVSVKPKSNAGIAVDANGVSVKIKSASGIGVDSGGIYLKVASTSEIGGVKLGTDTAPDEGMNASNLYLLKNSSDVAYVKTYVYSSFPQGSGARYYPYSADYINQNYSTKTEVTAEIASAVSDISGREYKIFPTLPAKGESQSWADFYAAYKKYIALVSNTGSEPDAYKEYILIVTNESTGECHWEQIGDTEFTTDNFVAKTDVLTQAEVASIVQDVFGF